MRFEIGDVVYLKSGSPPLTVGSIISEIHHVTWVDCNNNVNRLALDGRCFTKTKPEIE